MWFVQSLEKDEPFSFTDSLNILLVHTDPQNSNRVNTDPDSFWEATLKLLQATKNYILLHYSLIVRRVSYFSIPWTFKYNDPFTNADIFMYTDPFEL